jgi:hypothetical protein
LAVADSGLAVAQQNPLAGPVKSQDVAPVNPANSSDQPGQAIFIVRKLKEESKPNAN